jgi:arginine/ornithine N-succinyltransferase beta subunit
MFLRPAQKSDHQAILHLARQAGFGMTSLPPDEGVLAEKNRYLRSVLCGGAG